MSLYNNMASRWPWAYKLPHDDHEPLRLHGLKRSSKWSLDGGELALTPVALAMKAVTSCSHRPHAILQVPLVLQTVRCPLPAHVRIAVGRLGPRGAVGQHRGGAVGRTVAVHVAVRQAGKAVLLYRVPGLGVHVAAVACKKNFTVKNLSTGDLHPSNL